MNKLVVHVRVILHLAYTVVHKNVPLYCWL